MTGFMVRDECGGRAVARARAMRAQPTFVERRLWEAIRRRQLGGVKFRRQHPIGPYIVDFFAATERLAVDVDGPGHLEETDYDQLRQAEIEGFGVRFVRVSSAEVMEDLGGCLRRIAEAIRTIRDLS